MSIEIRHLVILSPKLPSPVLSPPSSDMGSCESIHDNSPALPEEVEQDIEQNEALAETAAEIDVEDYADVEGPSDSWGATKRKKMSKKKRASPA